MALPRSRTKPRRLSLCRAFAYPTSSQIRRCSAEVTRPSHRYSTRLAKKMNLVTNAVSTTENETSLAAHGSTDVDNGVPDNARCDPQASETTDLTGTETAESSRKSKWNDSPVGAFTLGTNLGTSVGLTSCNSLPKSTALRVGCSLARKRPPGGFKTPRPARNTHSKAQLQSDKSAVSSNKNTVLPRVGDSNVFHPLEIGPSVSFRTVSGNNLHTSDTSMTKAKQLMAMTDNSCVALDDQCNKRNLDGKGTHSLACGFQTGSIMDVSVSSDSAAEAKQLLDTAGVIETSVDPILSCGQLDLKRSFGHYQGVEPGTRKCISVSASSVVTASDLIESVDVVDPLADSMCHPGDTQQVTKGSSVQFGGFRTGSGKRMSVSASSMAKAKRLMESVDSAIRSLEIGTEPIRTTFATTSDFNRTMQETSSSSHGSFQGFQTVSGKAISVSAASVAKAKLLFESIQLNDSGILSGESDREACSRNLVDPCPQSDGIGCSNSKQLPVSEEALADCLASIGGRESISTGEYHKLAHEGMQTVGFQTAAGKPVRVSNASLAKAKQFVEELDENMVETSGVTSKFKKELPGTTIAVNLSDAEAQELAEACVADEVTSSDVEGSLCAGDTGFLSDDLDLSVFTQKTSWEIRESVKALLQSNSQDSDDTISDGASEACEASEVHLSDSLLHSSQKAASGMTEGGVDQTECRQSGPDTRGLAENILREDSLLTESLLRDTDKQYDTPNSQSNLMSKEGLHGQPEEYREDAHDDEPAGVSGSEHLDGELQHDAAVLDDSAFNTALMSERFVVSETVYNSHHEQEDHEMHTRESSSHESLLIETSHPVFVTASGHAVGVSESALQLAKQQLDHESNAITTGSVENSISQVETSAEDCQSKQPENTSFRGFCTAAGKKVAVSDEALAKAKAALNETPYHTSNDSGVALGTDKVMVTGDFSGFQTASGRNVAVSEQALDEVRRQCRPRVTPSFVGFQTASGRNVTVSEDALQQAKRILNDDQDMVESVETTRADFLAPQSFEMSAVDFNSRFSAAVHSNSRPSDAADVTDAVVPRVGFQTARGASVSVSDKSLQEARSLLDEDQVVIVDGSKQFSRSPSPASFASRRPQNVGSNGQTYRSLRALSFFESWLSEFLPLVFSYCPYRRTSSVGDSTTAVQHQSTLYLVALARLKVSPYRLY